MENFLIAILKPFCKTQWEMSYIDSNDFYKYSDKRYIVFTPFKIVLGKKIYLLKTVGVSIGIKYVLNELSAYKPKDIFDKLVGVYKIAEQNIIDKDKILIELGIE
jgi:hypothetical protein